MKTSVIEVKDMLSILSVIGVEKIIGKVPGVESVTVNYDAGSATVRYDETQIKGSELKAAAHQSTVQSEGEEKSKPGDKLKSEHNEHKHTETPKTEAPSAPVSTPTPSAKPANEAIKPESQLSTGNTEAKAPVVPKPSASSPIVKPPEEKEN